MSVPEGQAMDPRDPSLYVNRELSWLEFNQRVLEEASDPHNPTLEQLKFLAIVSSNLDEFFMVRVAGVMRQVRARMRQPRGTGLTSRALLDRLRRRIRQMVSAQYERLMRAVLPDMRAAGLRLLAYDELNDAQRAAAEAYFRDQAYAALSPLAVDVAHPAPHLHNLSTNFLVELDGDDPSQTPLLAYVGLPRALRRFVPLPSAEGHQDFVALEDVVRSNLDELFLGHRVTSAMLFRLTRDADLLLDEDDAEDLLKDIELALLERDSGEPVRLEVEAGADPNLLATLQEMLGVGRQDTYVVSGPLNLKDMFDLAGTNGYDDLRYRPFLPRIAPELVGVTDIFAAIRRQPILLHHPFDSFATVVDFLQQAAEDPQVLAIKMTLYRTSGDSPIVRALAIAAERGKQVAALVELKARFDEGPNIRWARQLEQSGVHVVYGLVGLKTHCKVLSVVRAEGDGLRFYLHLGTGNYHPTTAHLYTDCGLLTCDEALGEDVSQLFNVLTGYSDYPVWRKLAVAPKDLKAKVLALIRAEIERAQRGEEAWVLAKCNAIIEPDVIATLYEASQAGVKIELFSRGICGLRAGVPGVSENISVRSIVGRFLEHSRIFCFGNGGDPLVFMGSADWMDRNLNRRVETMFPIEDRRLRDYVLNDIMATYLADTAKTRCLQPDGTWTRVPRAADEPLFNAQEDFLRRAVLTAAAAGRRMGRTARFVPVRRGAGNDIRTVDPSAEAAP